MNNIISDMNKYLEKLEIITHKVIPYLLIILAIIIILDNPLWIIYETSNFETSFIVFDIIIIFFFSVDLIFKWFRVKNARIFIELYWIDIIAVLPFYLVFRIYREISGLLKFGEGIETGQKLAHESMLLKEAELLKEARVFEEAKLVRETDPIIRIIRFSQRTLRILKARFYVTHRIMTENKEIERIKKTNKKINNE